MSSAILNSKEDASRSTPLPSDIRQELHTILASEAFRGSTRCQTFLTYIVEAVCTGSADSLKERSLGTALFGRSPDYDTGADAIVRVKAHETRRRLMQYNSGADPERRVTITLSPGSYIPAIEQRGTTKPEPVEEIPAARFSLDAPEATVRFSRRWLYAVIIATLLLCAVVIGMRTILNAQRSIVLGFWHPIISPRKTILCTTKENAYTLTHVSGLRGDSDLALKLSKTLDQLGQATRMAVAPDLSESDLREAPVILIGGPGSNPWSMRDANDFRFGYAIADGRPTIVDHQNPSRKWVLPDKPPPGQSSEDYALITRILHSRYGQGMISIAGSSSASSHATGLILIDSSSLSALLRDAPDNWASKNLQIVIRYDRTHTSVGSPEVVAAAYW